ncbi:hypothetical protein NPIL_300331 [Nephila pilipes]|uniref:Uncharacterized protein n=1 Tax=Nephila pilipes TaxID=299642 RepID=A0A8X6M7U0_NEPPI|nr:hypothetical protein NPIL_523721 [Nephila pilipes]GFS90887.1 hypothetical protein NPIL_300331 [Nephila pilipes]
MFRTKCSGVLKNKVRMAIQYILKLLNCLLSDEALKDIESITKDQAASVKWNHLRQGRTSSLFGKVLHWKTSRKGLEAQNLGKYFSDVAIE